MSRLDCGVYGTVYTILKRSCDFLLYAHRRKRTVYYVSVNIWVRALDPCLLLLQSV